jgi:hypothetical protein
MRVKGWRGILAAFGTPSAGTMCLLGFGSGLPFLLVGYTLSIWLREFGLELGAIGLLSYVSLFYVFKFVWRRCSIAGKRRCSACLVAAAAGWSWRS